MRMSTLSNNLLFLVGRKKSFTISRKKNPSWHNMWKTDYMALRHTVLIYCTYMQVMTLILECSARRLIIIADQSSQIYQVPTFFSFPAQVCDVQIQRNATNFLISLTHILSRQFLSPPLICRSSIITPTLKLKCPKHTLTPDFLVYGPSGEISVFAQQIELTFCFFPPPSLFNLSCCIYKGSFHMMDEKNMQQKNYLHLLNINIFLSDGTLHNLQKIVRYYNSKNCIWLITDI